MRPITFRCNATLLLVPEVIAGQILDLARWPEFGGYGPLPGIRSPEFETRFPDVVGSRIRVTNRDGSSHVEEVVEVEEAPLYLLLLLLLTSPTTYIRPSWSEKMNLRSR